LTNFEIENNLLCYYTSQYSPSLALRPIEIHDNVIPASNSQLANNLYLLGNYFQNEDWILRSKKMLSKISKSLSQQGSSHSNWAMLALNVIYPFKQLAIVGNSVDEYLLSLFQHGITNSIFAVSKTDSNLPLTKNKYQLNVTNIFVCKNFSCQLPTQSIAEALTQIE
jgi:uncharacterized protein YyaL (SSP411 family)